MNKYFISTLFLLVILGLSHRLHAQDSNLKPYFGGSVNFFGIVNWGWGLETGVQFQKFNLGFEYGVYGAVSNDTLFTASLSQNYHPTDEAITHEVYFGIHSGIKISDWLSVGLIILYSTQSINRPTSNQIDSTTLTFPSKEVKLSWFNVGPDLRFYFLTHFIGCTAYTIRRGLKIGAAYVF